MRDYSHLKPYQFKPIGDKEVMKDMIKAGTNEEGFIEFWHKAGYTYGSARVKYFQVKRAIDNGDKQE
jgi:hypothetical protein